MRKFTSNYVVGPDGKFLKNGILVIDPNGMTTGVIDPKGDLTEMARLTFHSGIVISNFEFRKTSVAVKNVSANELSPYLSDLMEGRDFIALIDFIGLCKQIQDKFINLNIPEVFRLLTEAMLGNYGFLKFNIPGIFRLTGNDLTNLFFRSEYKIKQIA